MDADPPKYGTDLENYSQHVSLQVAGACILCIPRTHAKQFDFPLPQSFTISVGDLRTEGKHKTIHWWTTFLSNKLCAFEVSYPISRQTPCVMKSHPTAWLALAVLATLIAMHLVVFLRSCVTRPTQAFSGCTHSETFTFVTGREQKNKWYTWDNLSMVSAAYHINCQNPFSFHPHVASNFNYIQFSVGTSLGSIFQNLNYVYSALKSYFKALIFGSLQRDANSTSLSNLLVRTQCKYC